MLVRDARITETEIIFSVVETSDRTRRWSMTRKTKAPAEVESQKRFGFNADNIKVRAKFLTTFTDHGMKVPELLFLKVSNEIQLEADLSFTRQ